MLRIMSRPDLTPVSYVVLGIIARDGPSTPYDVKAAVGRGIAHFWQFPHSQIYSESDRLAGLGLLTEEREATGRRRRTYQITPEGREALRAWLAEPTSEVLQVRSFAFLKLYFGHFADPADIAALARTQLETFARDRAHFVQLLDRLAARGDRPWQLAVAELMNAANRVLAEQWERIARIAEDEAASGAAAGAGGGAEDAGGRRASRPAIKA